MYNVDLDNNESIDRVSLQTLFPLPTKAREGSQPRGIHVSRMIKNPDYLPRRSVRLNFANGAAVATTQHPRYLIGNWASPLIPRIVECRLTWTLTVFVSGAGSSCKDN